MGSGLGEPPAWLQRDGWQSYLILQLGWPLRKSSVRRRSASLVFACRRVKPPRRVPIFEPADLPRLDEVGGGTTVGWESINGYLQLWVLDEGPSLSNTANLFVPFFTTKPGGSGIGLVLSRQIAEAHGGTLTLENRRKSRGCEARLRLPL